MWLKPPAFFYPTSHYVLLPCQLVWQEAEVGKLDTGRNWRNLPILTCARRFKRRAQVKIGGLGGRWGLACEPYSPTIRVRGGQNECGVLEDCQAKCVKERSPEA